MLTVDAAVSAAAELLALRFGGRPELTDPEALSGSGSAVVVRARVAHNPFLQERTVIIKQLPPEALDGSDPALIREVVSYQFTNSLAIESRPGPIMLAYDLTERILITTDAGSAENFADQWEESDSDQQVALVRRLGSALGRMHRATAGGDSSFEALLHRMLSKSRSGRQLFASRDKVLVEAIDDGLDMIASMGVEIPDEVGDFAADAGRRLITGQHRAFTPFDLSPDNILCGNKRITFLDYEWAGFRDVTFDVASVIAGFPQSLQGSALSPECTDVFIAAWRQEVVDIWPNVSNPDRLTSRIVTALIGWSLLSVALLRSGGLTSLVLENPEEDIFPQLLEGKSRSREEYLVRTGIIDTFSAIPALCDRGRDPRFQSVTRFAEDVTKAIRELDLTVPAKPTVPSSGEQPANSAAHEHQ